MRLKRMNFSPVSCYFLRLRGKSGKSTPLNNVSKNTVKFKYGYFNNYKT